MGTSLVVRANGTANARKAPGTLPPDRLAQPHCWAAVDDDRTMSGRYATRAPTDSSLRKRCVAHAVSTRHQLRAARNPGNRSEYSTPVKSSCRGDVSAPRRRQPLEAGSVERAFERRATLSLREY